MDVPNGSLEVRLWIVSRAPLKGLLIRRDGDRWSGFQTRYRFTNGFGEMKRAPQVREVKPYSGWEAVWKRVEALGILTLPDSDTLPDPALVRDGVSYVVEINDGKHYRTYQYGNPRDQKWPEAKKIVEIVDVLWQGD